MGAKKKTLANRLARMSDEERARYLQHKSDMEEEAKRRKEQLIASFMKNKIKKEDGFSRLNLAKINQHWHHILRLNKCKQMKEDVEHMKKQIERVLDYKNRTIEKLLEELAMAEDQYSHNFNCHVTHIDQTIGDCHNDYLRVLHGRYGDDLGGILAWNREEKLEILSRARDNQELLKTVIFGQQLRAEENLKEDHESYLKKRDDAVSTYRAGLDGLVRAREAVGTAIWREIAAVVSSYVRQNDARRLHLAELRRLDAESAAEIANSQDHMKIQEEEIKILTAKLETVITTTEDQIENLQETVKELSEEYNLKRQQLRKEIETDEKKLGSLTKFSNNAIDILEKLKVKGEQTVGLMRTCRKFETEREKIAKYLQVFQQEVALPADLASSPVPLLEKVVIGEKVGESCRDDFEGGVADKFDELLNLEQFWLVFNKVDVDFKELRREKRALQDENKQFRGMIRAVLEAAVLAQSVPNSRVSTRAPSKRRSAASAPLTRIML